MKFLDLEPGETVELAGGLSLTEAVHQFEQRQVGAVNAALAAGRPLLVRGEPGVGKSQLARAAAAALGRVFVSFTVDARTESRDLLWHFDAVARLAEAQLIGALARAAEPGADAAARLRAALDMALFLHPRALWWAFHWAGALDQAARVGASPPPQLDGGDPGNGAVILIDEIDKAESDVPNGLLEALGLGHFHCPGRAAPVAVVGPAPLVVITTNEERALPDAFVRRCLVLHLGLPDDAAELIRHLVGRARVHFGDDVDEAVLTRAARLLVADRDVARDNHWLPLPGQAEYLDLLRAVVTREAEPAAQRALLERVAEFVLRKHPDAIARASGQRSE